MKMMNQLVPATDANRALTAEILESYIDFFEKTYLFSKETSKLPVKPVLLRNHSHQRCILCDFADPDQAVLECRSCGIMVHSACYHNVLYATLAPGVDPNSKTSKRGSRSTSRSRKAGTSSKDSSKSSDSNKSLKRRRNAHSMDVDEEEDSTGKTKLLSSRTRSRSRPSQLSSSMDEDSSDSPDTISMEVDGGDKTGSELLDVYSAPFADKVHDDGTWWCAKCSSEDPEKPACELCGRANGALFPRFILDEHGKPRILSRRKPFVPNQPLKDANEAETPETTSTSNTDAAVAAAALYTPIHFRNWRADPARRRGRRPRAPTNTHSEPEDIVWFHDICSRAKPLFYQHVIDPTHIDDEDELAIPVSDDEDDIPSKSPNSDEIPHKYDKNSKVGSQASKSSHGRERASNSSKAPSRSRNVEKKAKVMQGDRGRTCRLCGGHAGACVKCSEPDCGRHFHAHCAEQFGLAVERDEPLQFKCRIHSSWEDGESANNFLMELLLEEEEESLKSELLAHDVTVANHKPMNFGPRPAIPAPAPPQSTYTTGRLSSANKQPVRQVTPSYAAPRPSLLPLADPLPNYIFNYWLTKRIALGHELIHRLRIIKMDEMRKQEILDAVSDMETNLKKMITLRLYMERIRILVDLCKKREGLKRQQLDDFANLLTLPGIGDHAREITRQVYKNSPPPSAYNTPNKMRKLTEKSTPKSNFSATSRSPVAARPTPSHTRLPVPSSANRNPASPMSLNAIRPKIGSTTPQPMRVAATPTAKIVRPAGLPATSAQSPKFDAGTPNSLKKGRAKVTTSQQLSPKPHTTISQVPLHHVAKSPASSSIAPSSSTALPKTHPSLSRPLAPSSPLKHLPNGSLSAKKTDKSRKPISPRGRREESEDEMIDIEKVSPRLPPSSPKSAPITSTAHIHATHRDDYRTSSPAKRISRKAPEIEAEFEEPMEPALPLHEQDGIEYDDLNHFEPGPTMRTTRRAAAAMAEAAKAQDYENGDTSYCNIS